MKKLGYYILTFAVMMILFGSVGSKEVKAAEKNSIQFLVVDYDDKTVVPGATVELWSYEGSTSNLKTKMASGISGDDGRVTLIFDMPSQSCFYATRVIKGGYSDAVAGTMNPTLTYDSEQEIYAFKEAKNPETNSIQFLVVDYDDNTAVPGATVELWSYEGSTSNLKTKMASGISGDDGRVTLIFDMPSQSCFYATRVIKGGYSDAVAGTMNPTLTYDPDLTIYAFKEAKEPETKSIQCLVVDSEDESKVLSGATVELWSFEGNESKLKTKIASGVSGVDGRVTLTFNTTAENCFYAARIVMKGYSDRVVGTINASKDLSYEPDLKLRAQKESPAPIWIPVKKVVIKGTSNSILAGGKIQLTAVVTPESASYDAVTWKSSNTKYATVSANGKVTTKKAGKGKYVTITATAKDGSGVKDTYRIKIVKGSVTKITISGKKTVKVGKTVKLSAKVTGTTGAYKKVTWSSSNIKYATVSSTGKVKALKAGKGKTVTITVKALDGSGKKKTFKIKIK